MKSYIFLIGWLSPTSHINNAEDLKRKFLIHDDLHMATYRYDAPEGFGVAVGRGKAFMNGWSVDDSTSMLLDANTFKEIQE